MPITDVPDLREKRRWLTQAVMFVLGTVAGCYMAYLVNQVRVRRQTCRTHTHAGFVPACMARAPAVGTLWFLAIVRLDLTACVFSLLLFAAYVWGAGYRLVL